MWSNGGFQGDYSKFHVEIRDRAAKVRPQQTAQKMMLNDDAAYDAQKPFTVAAP